MHPEKHMKRYEAALARRKFDDVAPLLSDDATFWFTDGTHRGLDAIRLAFEKTWATLQNETYWLDDIEWIAVSDLAASCLYSFHWTADVDGTPCAGSGRGTTVLRLELGDWKIVHEHLSPFPKG